MAIEIQSGLHWWTGCIPGGESRVLDHFGPDSFGQAELRGGYGHPRRRVHESGMVVYSGSLREAQPVVIDASGTVCETWDKEIIGATRSLGGYVTRCDLAVDVFPPDQAKPRLLQLRRDYRSGRCVTTMKKDSFEFIHSDGETGGDTAYFGGKTSDARLRAYTQRGPLRLEWQYRPAGKNAGGAAVHQIHRYGVLPMWRFLSQTKLMFHPPWFVDLAEGDVAEVPTDARENSTLNEAMEQLRHQYGASLFAMLALGVKLEDLAVRPDVNDIKSTVRAKFRRWADEADKMGLDGQPLRDFLRARAEKNGIELQDIEQAIDRQQVEDF